MSSISALGKLGNTFLGTEGNHSHGHFGSEARLGRIFRLAGLPVIGTFCGDLSLELTHTFPYLRFGTINASPVPVPIDFVVVSLPAQSEFADLHVTFLARDPQSQVVPDFTSCGSCSDCTSCDNCSDCCSCSSGGGGGGGGSCGAGDCYSCCHNQCK